MAGNTFRPAFLGVGSALRRAREIRGVPLEAAARDTKLPLERLRALEEESFEELPGEVFIRAGLRTYAQYLGLDPAKVLGAYARHADEPEPPPPPAKMGGVERALAAARIRDSQKFFLISAAVVLATLVAVGLVSREGGPEVAALTSPTATGTPLATDAEPFTLVLEARGPVTVTVEVDGALEEVEVREGETVSYSALERLDVSVSDGGAVTATIAGHDLGIPTRDGTQWDASFTATSVAALGTAPSGSSAGT